MRIATGMAVEDFQNQFVLLHVGCSRPSQVAIDADLIGMLAA